MLWMWTRDLTSQLSMDIEPIAQTIVCAIGSISIDSCEVKSLDHVSTGGSHMTMSAQVGVTWPFLGPV